MNKAFENIPEVSFIDNMTLEDLQKNMVSSWEERYQELTGETIELSKANPYRLMLYACSLAIYQTYQFVETAGKNNLLKYSYGNFLDNIGTLRGVSRSPGTKANATFRFSLAAARATVTPIPAGSRISIGGVFFATTQYAEIPVGSTYIEVMAECTQIGTIGNGFLAGEVKTIVDSLPFISQAANTTQTANGTDIEDDNSFAERIYLAPHGYSVAGPKKAYEYFTKEVSADIADVNVSSPSDGNVNVCFILKNGVIPGSDMISRVTAYLNDESRRPLTDHISVAAPTTSAYNISLTYYINSSDSATVTAIQSAVTAAVTAYKNWQDSKIGRDINPDELVKLVKQAGAKRVVITAPTYTVVSATNIAHCGTITTTYGGLEDD